MKKKKGVKAYKWIDAVSHTSVNKDEIPKKGVKHYLAKVNTYGRIFYEDDDGVIICTHESCKDDNSNDDSIDFIAVPKQWRTKYAIHKNKKRKKQRKI